MKLDDYALCGRVILFGVLNTEKALFRWRGTTGFFISIPSNSKLLSGCK
jgi:hypothetical protein